VRPALLAVLQSNMASRTRTEGSINSQVRQIQYSVNGGAPTAQDITCYTSGKAKKMTDVITPQFSKGRNNGFIYNNPMESIQVELELKEDNYLVQQTEIRQSDGVITSFVKYEPKTGTPNYSRWFPNDLTVINWNHPYFEGSFLNANYPESGVSDAIQRTLAKCLANAAESDAQLLVTMAEAKKTLDSAERLITILPRLKSFLQKNGRKMFTPSGALKLAGNLAAQWLEYRYGFMQLYYDYKSYMTAYSKTGNARRMRFVSQETLRYKSNIPDVVTTNAFHFEQQYRYRGRNTIVSSGCLVQHTDPFDHLYHRGDVGIDRVGNAIWELVPFSFILDWFVDASTRISAHEGRMDQRVLCKWSTIRSNCIGFYSVNRQGRNYFSGGYQYVGQYASSYNAQEMIRHVRRVPDPSLSALPQINIKLNWEKFTDLASLLTQVIQSITRSK